MFRRKPVKRALTALMVLAAALAAALPVGAITNNYQPDNDHPFVGLFVALDSSGEFMWRCSGSLIDETTFVTAGHCTDQDALESPASARIYFQQDAGANYDPDLGYDPVSGYPDSCSPDPDYCREADDLYDYGFDEFAGFPNTHDVGVAILNKAYDPGEFGSLATAGALDALFSRKGLQDRTFLASGYGLSYSSPVGFLSFRERLMGYGKLVNTVSANNGEYNLQTQGNGTGNGGTCSGDSGGPIFYPADSNTIVAVTSFGLNRWCRGVDFSYRVDRAEVIAWITTVGS
jgi:hypothetical protein